MATATNLGVLRVSPMFSPSYFYSSLSPASTLSFPFCPRSFPYSPKSSHIRYTRKKTSQFELLLKQTTTEEEEADDDEVGEFEDGTFVEGGDYVEDDFEDTELYVGDGGGGGGIMLAGTWWDKEALSIAEKVSMSLDGDLKIYAFKTTSFTIQVRIEKLSSKYGSPSMTDIEVFSSAYRSHLDEAESRGAIPDNILLEVSSPGVERIVRIPQDLDRFKDLPMYVKYVSEVTETGSCQEREGVFRLVSFDMESSYCVWGLADVKINREQAGKGRPLSKKQREWRLQIPFDSLRLIRLYSTF